MFSLMLPITASPKLVELIYSTPFADYLCGLIKIPNSIFTIIGSYPNALQLLGVSLCVVVRLPRRGASRYLFAQPARFEQQITRGEQQQEKCQQTFRLPKQQPFVLFINYTLFRHLISPSLQRVVTTSESCTTTRDLNFPLNSQLNTEPIIRTYMMKLSFNTRVRSSFQVSGTAQLSQQSLRIHFGQTPLNLVSTRRTITTESVN